MKKVNGKNGVRIKETYSTDATVWWTSRHSGGDIIGSYPLPWCTEGS
jgi:hypothetical protein